MQNDNKYLVLQSDKEYTVLSSEKVAVIAYLYYEEGLDYYLHLLSNVPEYIDLFLITSNPWVEEKVKSFFSYREGCSVVLKNNRGRDISALLVSSKEILCNYSYICFLHDKKEKSEDDRYDFTIWTKSMWENLIYSKGYINRVIDILAKNELGLLVPVLDIGRKKSLSHGNTWFGNYDNTVSLLKRLGCNSNISRDVYPFSIGTMFWCNTKALKKLIDHEWREEDFCEEPMPGDGTISHAIERSFPYVVADAGYEYAAIMTDVFSRDYFNKVNHYLVTSLDIVERAFSVREPKDIYDFDSKIEKLSTFIKDHKSIYLYGAGRMGRVCLSTMITFLDYSPDGFIDQNKAGTNYHGIKVYALEEVAKVEGAGIIISVSTKFSDEVKHILEDAGIKDYLAIYD